MVHRNSEPPPVSPPSPTVRVARRSGWLALFKLALLFGLLCALGVAHVHLQLSIREMTAQRRALQKRREQLLEEQRRLSFENASLIDLDQMREQTQKRLHLVDFATDPR